MILHIINKSPFKNSIFDDCLRLCDTDSSILLIEDGVYAAQNQTEHAEKVKQHNNIHFYALEADVIARGLNNRLISSVNIINDIQFVELCTTHKATHSWY